MRVLITGASGFIGRRVVTRFLARGHKVRALVRRLRPIEWPLNIETIVGDLRLVDISSAFDDIDVVVHLAAAVSGNEDVQFSSTVMGTERFLRTMAAASAVHRIIHISSMVVYDWSLANGTLDETTPLNSNFYDMGGYHIAKIWQERLVKRYAENHKWDLTILRPGYIWGKGNAEIAGMGRRFGNVYVLFGPLSRLPLTHVENCADCIVTVAESPNSTGIFNVVDDDRIRVWNYARHHAKRTGRNFFFLPVPYAVGIGLARLFRLTSRYFFGSRGRLPSLLEPSRYEAQFKPLRYGSEKLRNVFGWTPILTYEECLDRTYGGQNLD